MKEECLKEALRLLETANVLERVRAVIDRELLPKDTDLGRSYITMVDKYFQDIAGSRGLDAKDFTILSPIKTKVLHDEITKAALEAFANCECVGHIYSTGAHTFKW